MAKVGKKYSDSVKLIDKSKMYEPAEALALVCQTSKAKFDETIEIHIRLGVDSRQRCHPAVPRCRKPPGQ